MIAPVAILSLHSHRDRSFLDDRELALISGDLSAMGVENELLFALVEQEEGDAAALAARLAGARVVVFERVWSRALVEAIRARLPEATFVACHGEHELYGPPADWECRGPLRRTVPALVSYLLGRRAAPPPHTKRRVGGAFRPPEETAPLESAPKEFRPNLRWVDVFPERRRFFRSFSVVGNEGCPYQRDARENPAYAGVELPEGVGKGCAFCTTGQRYEGRPPEEAARHVLEQLRTLRREAPELERIVLKDQNPFAYLPELLAQAKEEALGPFSLLLETRADWFLRSRARFARALAIAREGGLRIAPYLVGIESFSQAELDRYNKGIEAEKNEEFLRALRAWKEEFGPALDLGEASFGFVLFSPWTRLPDLFDSYEAALRTGFFALRGKLLLSRARLYPDTALYYLAARDGLLEERWPGARSDSARRYGYYPGHPWRFEEARIGRLFEAGAALSEATGGREEALLFALLLEAFDRPASDRPGGEPEPDLDALAARLEGARRLDPATVRARLSAMLGGEERFAGHRVALLLAEPGRLRIALRPTSERPEERPEERLWVELVPRGRGGPGSLPTRSYDLCPRDVGESLRGARRAAFEALGQALGVDPARDLR